MGGCEREYGICDFRLRFIGVSKKIKTGTPTGRDVVSRGALGEGRMGKLKILTKRNGKLGEGNSLSLPLATSLPTDDICKSVKKETSKLS